MSQLLAKIKNLTQSKFIRSVILVATGTAGAQAIAMAFSPIITRLYGPEAFGILGTFMATLGIVTPIAALAYPIAIVLPKSDDDAKGIAKLSLNIALAMTFILTAILLLGGEKIAALLGMQAIAGFMLLIPLAMLFSALQQIMQQWLIRKEQFSISARIAVSQSLILNSSKVFFGWFLPVSLVLVFLATLGNVLYAAQLWIGSRRWSSVKDRISTARVKRESLCKLAIKYKDFPIYRAPQVVLSSFSMSIPVFMLSALFGPASTGFYTLTLTILGAPSVLISKSVSDVFYPKAAGMVNNKKSISSLLLRSTLGLSLIGAIPLFIVLFFGPILFDFVFGEEWFEAGVYAQWISIFVFFNFINTPTVSSISVLGLQRWFLFYGVFSALMRVIGLYIGYFYYKDPVMAVAGFSIFGSLAYIYMIISVFIKSHTRFFSID